MEEKDNKVVVNSIKFTVPVYNYPVYLYYGEMDKIESILNSDKGLDLELSFTDGYSVWAIYKKGNYRYKAVFILLSKESTEYTVHHECIHAAWDILDDKGIIVDFKNHEQLTYLEGYIAKEVNKHLYKWKK